MTFFTNLLENPWLIQLGVFLSLVLIINFCMKSLFDRFKKRKNLSDSDWRVQLDHSVLAPVRALLWISFGSFIVELLVRRFELADAMFDPTRLRNAGIVFCVTWFLFRWKALIEHAMASRRVLNRKPLDPTSIEIVGKVYSIVVLFISSLILLQIFGLDIAPLVTFGGIGAAALGFASKDAISNFYGGMTIYLTRPFTVNDFIEIPQKALMGTIEKIGWYFTTMRDLSKRPVYIPNSLFATEFMVNLSRMTHRRIDERLSLRYSDSDKIEPLIHNIRKLLAAHSDIDTGQAIQVFVSNFAESAIILEIKAYTLSTRYEEFMEIKQSIMIRICQLIVNDGIGIGYPVREMVQRDSKMAEPI